MSLVWYILGKCLFLTGLRFKSCARLCVHGTEFPVAVVVAPVGKVLRTGWTFERTFTGVDSLMSLENLRIAFKQPLSSQTLT
jgi:hypothetical protein